MEILENSIICNNCKEKLISYHRHDFKMCRCMNCGCDGGNDYLKRIGNNYKEESVINKGIHSHTRLWLKWGQNYDKNMKRLPETKWVKIKDLKTDHIWAILLNVKNVDDFYKEVLTEEILHREEKWYNQETEFSNFNRYTEKGYRLAIFGKQIGKELEIFILACNPKDLFSKKLAKQVYKTKNADKKFKPKVFSIPIKKNDSAKYTFNQFCEYFYKKVKVRKIFVGECLKNKFNHVVLHKTFKPVYKLD